MFVVFALILGVFSLCIIAQKRFEQVVAPFACGVMLVCYPFALFRSPEGLQWFLSATALALLAVAVVLCAKKRRGLKQWAGLAFTPAFACFAALTVLLYFSTENRTVWWYDDIRYWGMEPRSLYLSGGFVDAAHHLAPDFAAYMPGMPLLQWLGLLCYGDWSEGVLYFALYLFCLCMLMPLGQRLTWKKAYYMPLFLAFAVCLPMLFYAFNYYVLGVDSALGLCFGYAMCLLWQMREPDDASTWRVAALTLALCALVMLKQVGALLWVLALSLVWVLPRGAVRRDRRYVLAFGASALALASWLAVCAANGYQGMHSSALTLHAGELLRGAWQAPEGFDGLIPNLWQAITHDLRGSELLPYHALVEIPSLARMLLFVAAPFALAPLARQRAKDMARLSLWSAAVFVLELVAIVFAFMTTFYIEIGEYVGNGSDRLALLVERYFSPIFVGLAMLMLFILLQNPPKGNKARRAVPCLAAVAAMALLGNWSSVYHYMTPKNYEMENKEDFESNLLAQNFWLDGVEEPESMIVLFGTEEAQNELWKWQYALAPVKLIYAPGVDPEGDEFAELVRAKQVTHILSFDYDNNVYRAACRYTSDGELYDNTLYTVCWDGDELSLEE